MRKATFGIVLAAVILFVPSVCMASPVTYTYTGNPYADFGGIACPPHCSLSGSFTVSASIGDNFDGSITPTSFSFTDGSLTISNSNLASGFFLIITNSVGQITGWGIDVVTNNNDGTQNFLITGTANLLALTTDQTILDSISGVSLGPFAENFNDPGTWTSSSVSGTTPEPSSLLLLGTGLLGLGPFIRHRLAS